jgi:hypothetical protein
VFEFFTPLPLDAPQTFKKFRGASVCLIDVQRTGDFVAVKDYQYVKVAKRIGETQVGVNLFYLLDNSTIIGYRNATGYYLRGGASGRKKKKQTQAQ